MAVRIIGVPVIDRDPVEFRAEIPLRIRHQLPCEGSQVDHLSRILRRNDETEVVAIFLTSLSESALIDGVGSRIEHAGPLAVAGDAIPLQVSDVLYKWRRAESISAMADDARLDHHPTRRRAKRQGQRRGTASAEAGANPSSLPAKTLTCMPGFPGSPHDLANKAPWSRRSAPSIADAARTDS